MILTHSCKNHFYHTSIEKYYFIDALSPVTYRKTNEELMKEQSVTINTALRIIINSRSCTSP